VITVDNLSKTFTLHILNEKRIAACRDISFSVPPGGFLGLSGPSGAGLVAVTGGMSVDPDDQTPAAIRATGARVVSYGAPAFPGAMFMLAYLGDVPIIGLPGCVMYFKASIFDLIVPRILAGETIQREDIIALGHGGFCASCPSCHYPQCGFGKG